LTTAVKPSSAGYTRELEPGHSGRAKSALYFDNVLLDGGVDYFLIKNTLKQ
jgi:hypothetical protein